MHKSISSPSLSSVSFVVVLLLSTVANAADRPCRVCDKYSGLDRVVCRQVCTEDVSSITLEQAEVSSIIEYGVVNEQAKTCLGTLYNATMKHNVPSTHFEKCVVDHTNYMDRLQTACITGCDTCDEFLASEQVFESSNCALFAQGIEAYLDSFFDCIPDTFDGDDLAIVAIVKLMGLPLEDYPIATLDDALRLSHDGILSEIYEVVNREECGDYSFEALDSTPSNTYMYMRARQRAWTDRYYGCSDPVLVEEDDDADGKENNGGGGGGDDGYGYGYDDDGYGMNRVIVNVTTGTEDDDVSIVGNITDGMGMSMGSLGQDFNDDASACPECDLGLGYDDDGGRRRERKRRNLAETPLDPSISIDTRREKCNILSTSRDHSSYLAEVAQSQSSSTKSATAMSAVVALLAIVHFML